MSNSFDQIATVNIDIASALIDSASFDNILIVGPLPKVTPSKTPASVGVYSDIDEVINAGWSITEDPVGIAARVAFSQAPKPTRIYIAPQQIFSSMKEYAIDTVKRAMNTAGWWCVCPAGVEAEELVTVAEYIETQEKFMVYTEMNFFGSGEEGANKATVSTALNRTAGVYGKVTATASDSTPDANAYMNVAFAVAWLAHESGSETAAFKSLVGMEPCEMSTSEKRALEDANISFFTAVGNKKVTMIGKVLSGEWCDIIRFRDWLKNDMQVRVANLFVTLPKLPFTDAGIALIQNQMEASLQNGQQRGGICETEYDDEGEEIVGYVVSVPASLDITDAEKASRKLAGCEFKARLAGAIHFAELKGTLAYSI